jgi:peptide/nickel transport system substrate-binding protein
MRVLILLALSLVAAPVLGAPAQFIEPPILAERVAKGELPPVASRLPDDVAVVPLSDPGLMTGRHGGSLRLLMGRAKDTRMMIVYGYARLVGYDRDFNLVADILSGIDIEEGRIFTLRLRRGHKWSDGQPFTAEDLRFYWEDVANNEKLPPAGPPRAMLVNGEKPKFEVINETTVRYTWSSPNPFFLPRLAGASPLSSIAPPIT